MDDEDYEPQDWELPPAFCDNVEVHDGHVYRAINGNSYRCDGFTEQDAAELDYQSTQVCSHGMSAQLCAGPQHYPMDDRCY